MLTLLFPLLFLQTPAAEAIPPAKFTNLQGALEELAERYHLPGLSVAVVHQRKLVWSTGIGYADLEGGVWAAPETRYRLASVSKPFAAVLALQLVEEGKLALDASMKDFWIPTWFAPDPLRYRAQPITVRHVLEHTSEGTPGQRHAYNGNVYADLTYVLEDVTHTAYPRLLEERIFARAGMERSLPGQTRAGSVALEELAIPYRWDGAEYVRTGWQMMDPDPRLDMTHFEPVYPMPAEALARRKELLGDGFMHLNAVSAAGEATSTVLDLARFDIALDEGKLLSAASRELMWTPRVVDGAPLPYALGWFVEEFAGRKVIWHYGWLPPGVSALYLKVPPAGFSFFLLANSDGLSASFPWTREGVRASPFARALLTEFGLDRE
ncbi:MAG: serine hydrolase domain-containing protein [Planctomycetota bacterium]